MRPLEQIEAESIVSIEKIYGGWLVLVDGEPAPEPYRGPWGQKTEAFRARRELQESMDSAHDTCGQS